MKGGLLWCMVLAAVVAGVVQAQDSDTKPTTAAAVTTGPDASKSNTTIDTTTEAEITDPNSESGADSKTSDKSESTVAPSEDQVAEGVMDNDDDDDVVESKVDDMEEYVEDGEVLEEEEEAEEMRVQPESPSSEGQGSVPDGDSDAPPQLAVSVPAMIGGVLMVLRLNL